MCRELAWLKEQEKEEYAIWCPNDVEGRERSRYQLQLLHGKSKKHQSQEQVAWSIHWCSNCHQASPHGPDLPVPVSNVNMKSSSDSESSDTTDTTACVVRRGRPTSAFDTSLFQWPDTRPEPFQGFYPATGFSSLGDRSTRTWNNILLVLRTSKRI